MSNDRLFTTSYRYEIVNLNSKTLRQALAAQNSRTQMDEMIASRERSEQLAQQELERSSWLASLDEKSEKRRTARELVALKEESKHGNREILLLRRSRLRQLINQELQEQEKELNAIGVAFYVKRI